MLKNQVSLEVKKDERLYQLLCASDSPLGELYDSLNQMRSFVIEKILENQKAQEPKEEKKDASES